MSETRNGLGIDPAQAAVGQEELFPVEGGEAIIAPGQVAFFPDQPEVIRWKDADNDSDHRPIDVGPNAICSCGWKGAGWTQHFSEVAKQR